VFSSDSGKSVHEHAAGSIEATETKVRTGPRKRVALLLSAAQPCNRDIISGIAETIRERGLRWELFLDEDFHPGLEGIAHWDGDGVIASFDDPRVERALQACTVPLVGVGTSSRDARGYPPAVPFVASDEQALVRAAYEHLIEQGFSHFAMFSQPQRAGVRYPAEREQAYREIVARDGGEAVVYPGSKTSPQLWRQGMAALAQWLHQLPKPVGIIALTEARARLLMQACELAGYAVPAQVGIIAIDHGTPAGTLTAMPLTAVLPGSQEMGRRAACVLDQLLQGSEVGMQPIMVPPAGIRSGASCMAQRRCHPHVMRALHFIRQHARRRIKTEQVADYVGISRSWLEFHFKRELGHTVHEEILCFKLQEAKRMLSSGAADLRDVAVRCGFNSLQYLYAVFAREVGCTPRAWQERELRQPEELEAA
jgi:LacI family transcriptional regulator